MKVLVAALLLVAGAVTALTTVALHPFGWGFLLGAVATVAALFALGAGWSTRLAFGVGWVGFIAWVTPTRSEGDFAISSDPAGFGLIGLALVVLVYSVVTLPRPRRGDRGGSVSAPRMTT
jgi:peptidoglycan/LPS O-acetylase OafA/YrhL